MLSSLGFWRMFSKHSSQQYQAVEDDPDNPLEDSLLENYKRSIARKKTRLSLFHVIPWLLALGFATLSMVLYTKESAVKALGSFERGWETDFRSYIP